MSVLLLFRAMSDLTRACREASEILAIQYCSRKHDESDAEVLGTWIEPSMVQEFPVARTSRDQSGARWTFPVGESAGVPYVWMMRWLDVADGTGCDDVRNFIVQALMENSMPNGAVSVSGQFAPVFAANTVAEALQDKMRCLRERFPDGLSLPLFQGPVTGRLLWFQGGGADG
ncbi:MAG: hypothetical protein ACYC97_11600 [Metallibacterium sp.]